MTFKSRAFLIWLENSNRNIIFRILQNSGTTNQNMSTHINTYRMVPVYHGRVQACIFDWAGNLLWSDISAYDKRSLTKFFQFSVNNDWCWPRNRMWCWCICTCSFLPKAFWSRGCSDNRRRDESTYGCAQKGNEVKHLNIIVVYV